MSTVTNGNTSRALGLKKLNTGDHIEFSPQVNLLLDVRIFSLYLSTHLYAHGYVPEGN